MGKLNQVIAVVSGKKKLANEAITSAYHTIQKETLFEGISRTYTPRDEEGERFPAEVPLRKTAHGRGLCLKVDMQLMGRIQGTFPFVSHSSGKMRVLVGIDRWKKKVLGVPAKHAHAVDELSQKIVGAGQAHRLLGRQDPRIPQYLQGLMDAGGPQLDDLPPVDDLEYLHTVLKIHEAAGTELCVQCLPPGLFLKLLFPQGMEVSDIDAL